MQTDTSPRMIPVTTILAMIIIVGFVLAAALFTETTATVFGGLSNWILANFKWYYIVLVGSCLFFCIWLAVSRYGNIRLGDDDEKPEYGLLSWFSMLFSAGMGIGLVFWSIAEPIYHFQSNPFTGDGMSPESAATALRITYFHWGLHPWAIYSVTGLAMAYFAFRRKLPLTIRSCLYPLIGERIYGGWGHAVDILAVFATVFGVATSLGLGVTQINTGLGETFGLESSIGNQLILIAVISIIATISVVSGVGRGIKWLSQFNMGLTVLIMLFLLVFGPTLFLISTYLQSTSDYMAHVLPLAFWTDTFTNSTWQNSWTAFYWAWWIAWAPFVGMFIARISRGRTIREFIVGVLLAPTLMGGLWITLFGSNALYLELFHTLTESGETVAAIGQAGIVDAVNADVSSALYATLDLIQGGTLGWVMAVLTTLLIVTYFVTSSDSGTLVVTTILSQGAAEPPTVHRVTWGLIEGAVAAVLLLVGGLSALQMASITAAFPFSFVMIVMMIGLVKGLREEDMRFTFTRKDPLPRASETRARAQAPFRNDIP